MGEVLPCETLRRCVQERQARGERAVFTNGCFDLLHVGHVTYLQQARALGDFLIVGLNSDESVRRIKGSRRPLVPEFERAALVAGLACVDYVTIFGDNTAESVVRVLRPQIYVKGSEYARGRKGDESYLLVPEELRAVLAGETHTYPALAGLARRLPEARVVAEYGGSLALLAGVPDHSTSDLIQRIVERYGAGE